LYETAALKPPFTATSMDGLYKKVLINFKKGNERGLSWTSRSVFTKTVKLYFQMSPNISFKTSYKSLIIGNDPLNYLTQHARLKSYSLLTLN